MDSEFLDVVGTVCDSLERCGVEYALTGSVVSGVYGEPIISEDVDICVVMNSSQATMLTASLSSRFFRSPEALQDAVRTHSLANVIDVKTQFKVDLSVVPDEPFYRSAMARRRRVSYPPSGAQFWSVSPEDVVLMKLLWRRETGSRKQWENALSVIRTQRMKLDWVYLREWAGRLDLLADVERMRDEAGI